MDKFVGKRLDGRYEIREIIGVGGMAVVYKAYDSIEDRIVAIKILKEEFASNEEFQRRFKNESKAIAVLSHPNIVKVYDVSFGDLIQYIVMEYIEGITLKEYIENNSGLEWGDAVSFAIQILRGLQHAHDKGIVHRDVKPQNIMVLADKTIKVTDFGIARFARKESQTITDKAIGSVHYISPEQAKGEFTDEKADIYSLGVIMYEMLTGTVPFEAESAVSVAIMQLQTEPKLPTHINPLIPLGLEQITMKAMQKDTQNRYKSAAEMLRDLEQFKRDPSTVFHNSYFVDDSPTRAVENLYDDDEILPNGNKEAESQNNKVPVVAILTGVAVAFIAAIVILLILVAPKLFGSQGEKFECPDFFGMNQSQLAKYEEELGLKFSCEYGTPETDLLTEIQVGEIYKQNPQEGTLVGKDTVVTVTICNGDLDIVEVPNVEGYEASRAHTVLLYEEFEVEIVSEHSDEVAEGLVIRTDPVYGSKLAPGSKIKLFVSLGVLKEPIEVPDVTRHSLEEAKRLIERAGFKVGSVSEVSSEPNFKGYVVSQSPTGGSGKMAEKGTAIDIYVGNGVPVYKFKLDVDLPTDYKHDHGYISAWIDGVQVCADQNAGKVEISKLGKVSYNISTAKTTVEVTIKLSPDNSTTYHNYITYTVDATTGGISDFCKHSYLTKQSGSADNSSNITDTSTGSEGVE